MRLFKIQPAAVAFVVLGFLSPAVFAADHADGPRATADPAADITDLFAWMSPDAGQINLVMNVVRNATQGSRFSDSVRYVFHTTSAASYGAPPAPEVTIVCQFNKRQRIRCQVQNASARNDDRDDADDDAADDDSNVGDAGYNLSGNGLARLRVFAGLRDDPFFFNLAGFRATARTVAGVAGGLTFDAAGCPALDAATVSALVHQLQSAPGGGPAVDGFARFNVLSIVVSVDATVVTRGGPIVGVWGGTYRRPGRKECKSGRGRCDLVQIDRMGRPGVNTALTNPFYRESIASEELQHETIIDAYNAPANPMRWQGLFAPEIAANLAILDALDGVCGNQLLTGPSPAAGRYDALAGVLADDRLYVNTSSGACGQYLAVEANALGITNNDCGGRTPLEDTIDTTYSLLAAGALAGVGDGVPIDADGTASLDVFPFLADPN